MDVESTPLVFADTGIRLAADRWRPRPATGHRGTVLLLHGGGQTRHSWRTTGARLAAHGWTTIALDARGHGESEWAPDGDYSTDAMVADLRGVVATLPERPVLVGASMGGMTSLIAQGEDPELARAVVLVDVTPRVEPEGTAEITAFMRSGAAGFATLQEAVDAVVAYTPHRKRPPRPEGLRKNLRRFDGRWYWHWDPRLLDGRSGGQRGDASTRQLEERARRAARNLTVPTLLVRGGASRVVSEAGARELQALVPSAVRLDVEGAGHMVAGDDNDEFGGGLLDFLESLPPA